MTLADLLLPRIAPIPSCAIRYGAFQDQHLSASDRIKLGQAYGTAKAAEKSRLRRMQLVRSIKAYVSAYGLFNVPDLQRALNCSASLILSIFATELAGSVEFDERRQKMIFLGN